MKVEKDLQDRQIQPSTQRLHDSVSKVPQMPEIFIRKY